MRCLLTVHTSISLNTTIELHYLFTENKLIAMQVQPICNIVAIEYG